MGIHNEPGNQRLELPRLNELVDKMSTMLTSTADEERSFLPFKNDGSDEVVLMVNNLGAMSELELSGVAGEGGRKTTPYVEILTAAPFFSVLQSLKAEGYNVRRILAGTYMVSQTLRRCGCPALTPSSLDVAQHARFQYHNFIASTARYTGRFVVREDSLLA